MEIMGFAVMTPPSLETRRASLANAHRLGKYFAATDLEFTLRRGAVQRASALASEAIVYGAACALASSPAADKTLDYANAASAYIRNGLLPMAPGVPAWEA
jgi:hypothetical protein